MSAHRPIRFLALLALVLAPTIAGCELVTKFDRSKIDASTAAFSSPLVEPSDAGVDDASR